MRFLRLLLMLVTLPVAAFQQPGAPAVSRVPENIRFAGTLDGDRFSSQTVSVVFAIYSSRTGGAPLWQETQNVSLDAAGRYAVLLGTANPLPSSAFSANEARWLGIQVLADAEPEQPRVMLVSVPYALKAQDADTLGGLPASAFLRADSIAPPARGSNSRKTTGQAAALELEGTVSADPHTTNAIPKFTSTTDTLADSMMFELYDQVAVDAVGHGLANEDVVKLGDGTGRKKRFEVDGRLVGQGFDMVTTLPNAVHAVSTYVDGVGMQANADGIGFSSGITGTSRGLNGAGVVGFALPPLSLQPQAPGDYALGVLATNYHPQGAALEAFNAYDGTALGADFPVVSGNIGVYSGTAHSSAIPLVLEQLASSGPILSARAQGTEVASMNSAGDLTTSGSITATGTVTAASFSGSGAGLTGVTASGFATNPNDCASGKYANAIEANGNLGCSSIQASELPNLSGSYVDRTSAQTIGGLKTFTDELTGTFATFSREVRADVLTLENSSWNVSGPHGVLFMGGDITMHKAKDRSNIFVGTDAGGDFLVNYSGTTPGTSNTGIGNDALRFLTTGYSNTAAGFWALRTNTTGYGNTGLGFFAQSWFTTGNYNTSVGWAALGGGAVPGTGSYNTAVGASSLQNVTAGNNNAALGRYAAFFNETGSNNTSIGVESGMSGGTVPYGNLGNRNTTGSNNTYLGYRSGPSADGFNNATAIGANSVVSASNALVLGDSSVSVGIGTSAPAFKLDVAGTIRSSTGGFRFPDGTVQTTAATGNLGANPTDCPAGQYANAIDESGNLTCAQVAFSQLSGTANVAVKNADNNFTTGQTVTGTVTANAISLPETTDITNGTIALAGVSFIHSKSGVSCCIGDPAPFNTFVGREAGNFTQASAFNTGIGTRALRSLTTGETNTAVGSYSLFSNTTGGSSTAIGAGALGGNTTGSANTGVGSWALAANPDGNANTAIGHFAMNHALGSENVAVGIRSLNRNDGAANTVVGSGAMEFSMTANRNSGLGYQTLSVNYVGNENAAIGYRALWETYSGSYNVGIGSYSGSFSDSSATGNVSGSYNTFIGYSARPLDTGLENATAIGANAFVGVSNGLVLGQTSTVKVGIGTAFPAYKLDVAGIINSSTGGFRFPDGTVQTTAFSGALGTNPTDCSAGQYANAIDASGNLTCAQVAFSQLSGTTTVAVTNANNNFSTSQTVTGTVTATSGSFNRIDLPATTGSTAGLLAIANTPVFHAYGTDNLFIGAGAGNFSMTGDTNLGIGPSALANNSTGPGNIAIGHSALITNTTGSGNIALGIAALRQNQSGYANSALGYRALADNVTGVYNTAAGTWALTRNTGSYNTGLGGRALENDDTGSASTAVGFEALSINRGDGNTAVGYRALWRNSSGMNNTAIGRFSGAYNDPVFETGNSDGSYNTFIGYQARPNDTGLTNATAIGANARVNISNAMVLGDSSVNIGIGTGSPNAKLQVANGDVAITTQSNGVILRATDGPNCFRVTVNNSGTLSTSAVSCP